MMPSPIMEIDMKNTFQKSLMVTWFVSGIAAGVAQGAVVLEHWYQMGETGALPADSAGSADFTTINGSAASIVSGVSGAPGSTSYLYYQPGSFSSGAALGSVPSDNFALGGWFRVDTILPSRNDVTLFRAGAFGGGRPDLLFGDGGSGDHDGWAASLSNVSWVGPAFGVENSAEAGVWAHLAIVRDNGSSTFYINGIAQGPSTNGAASWGDNAILGASRAIAGQGIAVDDLRIYSFTAGEGAQAVSAFFNAVPEPGSMALLGAAALYLCSRRRDRAGE